MPLGTPALGLGCGCAAASQIFPSILRSQSNALLVQRIAWFSVPTRLFMERMQKNSTACSYSLKDCFEILCLGIELKTVDSSVPDRVDSEFFRDYVFRINLPEMDSRQLLFLAYQHGVILLALWGCVKQWFGPKCSKERLLWIFTADPTIQAEVRPQ